MFGYGGDRSGWLTYKVITFTAVILFGTGFVLLSFSKAVTAVDTAVDRDEECTSDFKTNQNKND